MTSEPRLNWHAKWPLYMLYRQIQTLHSGDKTRLVYGNSNQPAPAATLLQNGITVKFSNALSLKTQYPVIRVIYLVQNIWEQAYRSTVSMLIMQTLWHLFSMIKLDNKLSILPLSCKMQKHLVVVDMLQIDQIKRAYFPHLNKIDFLERFLKLRNSLTGKYHTKLT